MPKKESGADYVRRTYNVPAKRGMYVEIYYMSYAGGDPTKPLWWSLGYRGKITSFSQYIHVNGLGFHPTDGVVYYDKDFNVLLDTREPV